jgi:hypothetical protein
MNPKASKRRFELLGLANAPLVERERGGGERTARNSGPTDFGTMARRFRGRGFYSLNSASIAAKRASPLANSN